MCHTIVIANQERSFWKVNQSDCENVIDNTVTLALSLCHSSEINIFFGVEHCGKEHIECGSSLSVLLTKTIFVITKFVVESRDTTF